MPVEFTMPKLGLTMEEGTIREWLVVDGATVSVGTAVLVIETDKTETEVEVSGTGVLRQAAAIGDTLKCGEVIGYLLGDGESAPAPADPATTVAPASSATTATAATVTGTPARAATARERVIASPNAHRVATELGVDIHAAHGTGPGGRVTSEDVHDLAGRVTGGGTRDGRARTLAGSVPPVADAPRVTGQPVPGAGQPVIALAPAHRASTVAARQLADMLGIDLAAVPADAIDGRVSRDGVAAYVRELLARPAPDPTALAATQTPPTQTPASTIPMTGMRGTIARRMHASLHEMAQLTLNMDATMTAVVRDRERRKKHAGDGQAVPGYTDYVVAAAARALREHPQVNAQVVGDEIALLPDVHVGLAVAVDGGLVVPVVRHADRLGLVELSTETSRLAESARSRSLALTDTEGGTFSVTALGMFGVDGFTPVINPPNAAILGVGRLRDDVAIRHGKGSTKNKLSTVTRLTLSLTWDHRVLDGAPAAAFTKTIVGLLADPDALDVAGAG